MWGKGRKKSLKKLKVESYKVEREE